MLFVWSEVVETFCLPFINLASKSPRRALNSQQTNKPWSMNLRTWMSKTEKKTMNMENTRTKNIRFCCHSKPAYGLMFSSELSIDDT